MNSSASRASAVARLLRQSQPGSGILRSEASRSRAFRPLVSTTFIAYSVHKFYTRSRVVAASTRSEQAGSRGPPQKGPVCNGIRPRSQAGLSHVTAAKTNHAHASPCASSALDQAQPCCTLGTEVARNVLAPRKPIGSSQRRQVHDSRQRQLVPSPAQTAQEREMPNKANSIRRRSHLQFSAVRVDHDASVGRCGIVLTRSICRPRIRRSRRGVSVYTGLIFV